MTSLFGRVGETGALSERLDRVGAGAAQIVFLEGEAGHRQDQAR
jgi:hypothetical protein